MIVFLADIHFGWQNFNKTFFNYQLEYYEKILFPFLLENNIKDVICLGDLVHHRELMDIYIQQQLKERFYSFFEKNKIKFHYLVGNHDLYYKSTNDISYAYTINYNSFHIIDEPQVINFDGLKVGLVPWGKETMMPKPEKVDMLCGHFEINGFLNNNGNDGDNNRLRISHFEEYSNVYSGHYHIQDKKSNIQYLGSPYQMRRDDFGTPKGFWCWDGSMMKFIENTTSPKYVKVFYNNNGDKPDIEVDDGFVKTHYKNENDAVKQIGNNFVDITIEKVVNKKDLDKFISDIPNYKRSKDVKAFNDFTKEMENVDEDANNLELCLYYIEHLTFEDDINKDFIKTRISVLYEDAKDEVGE